MGINTELIFGVELKKDIPKEVIDILLYMVKRDCVKEKILKIPEHNFFKTSRWKYLLNSSSPFFGVSKAVKKIWFDYYSETWHISTRSNIKNYDGEIEKFLDWIKPYIEDGSGARRFYAIVCYEEELEPKIYYLESRGKKNVLCDECGTSETGITQDGKSRYIKHKLNCCILSNHTSFG